MAAKKRKQVTIYDPSHTNIKEFVKAKPMDNPHRRLLVTEIDGVTVSVLPSIDSRGLLISIEPTLTRYHEITRERPGAVRNALFGIVHAFNERLIYKGVHHDETGEDDAPYWFLYEAEEQEKEDY